METPWKVVGFEKFVSEKGDACIRLYVARPLVVPEGNTGEGLETHRLFYKPEYVDYNPVIGHIHADTHIGTGFGRIVIPAFIVCAEGNRYIIPEIMLRISVAEFLVVYPRNLAIR